MTETIQYTIDDDGIATLAIDVPDESMNIVNQQFLADLKELVEKVASDDAIKGAIITSAKPAFMAGADLRMLGALAAGANEMGMAKLVEALGGYSQILRGMETSGKPFVAAVNGLALGGGLEIALACHHRLVADDPKIQLGLPEVMVGLLPGAGGTQRVVRLAGVEAALRLMTIGKPAKPAEAVGMGLFDAAVPASELLDKAKAWLMDKPFAVQPWDKKGFKIPGGGGAMHPKAVQTFMAANAMSQEKSMHNYPAVPSILSCVYEGSIVPMDAGLRIETRYMAKLVADPQATNMIRTLFVNKQAADKLARRPEGVDKHTVRTLGMLGAGMMGAGIAYVSAKAGMNVILLDRDVDAAEKGKDYARKLVEKGVKRRKTTEEKGAALLGRIRTTDNYADLGECDLIIEAVFEDPKIKADVTAKTEAVISTSTVFASNTSTLPISDLAENFGRPHEFIGIHFFSPVDKMPLVEIIMGEKTDQPTLAKALDYVQQIKKTPIVVNDSRGFYTSRCFGTYVQEGAAMVMEGVKPALIENAGRMSGMPVGPLAVGDEVSIELSHHVGQATKDAMGDAYVPSPADDYIERMLVELGRKGRKNAKGAYVYPEGGKKYLWPELAEHFPVSDEQPDVGEVKKRFLIRQAVEAARCFEEGVLTTPEDGDVGAIFGWGYAPWTGGPLSYIDTMGASEFVAEADRMAQAYGPRFTPPKLLREMAEKDERFYS